MNRNEDISPVISTQFRRSLTKSMRVVNFFYKLTLGLLSGVNFTMMMLNANVKKIHISEFYFETMSVVLAVIPILWSYVLDSCKDLNVRVENVISNPPSPNQNNNIRNTLPPLETGPMTYTPPPDA